MVNSNWSYSPESPNLGQIRRILEPGDLEIWLMTLNKANLRDLRAASGLVILLQLGWNHQFFSPCDLEIWWMTSKNYRAPRLHYIKLCASSQTPRWIQTGITVWKTKSIFFCPLWRWNLMEDLENNQFLVYATSNAVHHFKAMGEFKLKVQTRNTQFRSKSAIF